MIKIIKKFKEVKEQKAKKREADYKKWAAEIEKSQGDDHGFVSLKVLEAYIDELYQYFDITLKKVEIEDQNCEDDYFFTEVIVVETIKTKKGEIINLKQFESNDDVIYYLENCKKEDL